MVKLTGSLYWSSTFLVIMTFLCSRASVGAQAQTASPASGDSPPIAKTNREPAALTPIEMGDVLFSQRRYEEAIAAYSGSPQVTAVICIRIGTAYMMMQNTVEAVRSYKRSLKLEPKNPLALNNLATIDASGQEYGEAECKVRKALRFDPGFALGYMNLGTILILEHKLKQGQAAYAQAMALDPLVFNLRNRPKTDNPAPAHDRGAMNYSIAAACAHAGNVDCALRYLRASLDEGYSSPSKVVSDGRFSSLNSNAEFRQLLTEQRTR
jgi:tetratricopeptide (TPR) repeat protein